MAIAFVDDLDLFLPVGQTQSATLNGRAVRGYFDENFVSFNSDGMPAEGRNFTYYLKSSDVAAAKAKRGSTLILDGSQYQVTEVKPEGDGAFAELDLRFIGASASGSSSGLFLLLAGAL